MRSGLVDVRDVLLEHATEVLLVEYQQVIKTIAAHAPEQVFTNRVRPWCHNRRTEHLNPGSHRTRFEVRAVFRVIADHHGTG